MGSSPSPVHRRSVAPDGSCWPSFSRNPVVQIILSCGCCLSSLVLSILVGCIFAILALGGPTFAQQLENILVEFIKLERFTVERMLHDVPTIVVLGLIGVAVLNSILYWLCTLNPIPHAPPPLAEGGRAPADERLVPLVGTSRGIEASEELPPWTQEPCDVMLVGNHEEPMDGRALRASSVDAGVPPALDQQQDQSPSFDLELQLTSATEKKMGR